MNLARPGEKKQNGKEKIRTENCARRAEQIENSFIYEPTIDPSTKRDFELLLNRRNFSFERTSYFKYSKK